MIELMVVIGILALLAAIVIPAANSLLTSNRTKATLTTMKVIENAMEEFRWQGAMGTQTAMSKEDDEELAAVHVFGSLPPSPNSTFAIDPEQLTDYSNAQEPPGSDKQLVDPRVGEKFVRLLSVFFKKINISIASAPDSPNPEDFAGRYSSIECLYLILTQCCPSARNILDQLPGNSITNLDRDTVTIDTGRSIDLLEIVDAWGRPLRYSVKRPRHDANGRITIPARWELRSAGPDGAFGVLGSKDEDSDDVVLRGP